MILIQVETFPTMVDITPNIIVAIEKVGGVKSASVVPNPPTSAAAITFQLQTERISPEADAEKQERD
jgi:hypothetical protein